MTPPPKAGANVVWTKQMIVYAIDLWHRKHLRAPSAHEWWLAGSDHPSHYTVRRVFGSWNAAIRATGLRPRARGEARNRPPRKRCPKTGRFIAHPKEGGAR